MIAGNLLSAVDESVESGLGNYQSEARATVSWDQAMGLDGTHSVKVTILSGSGDIYIVLAPGSLSGAASATTFYTHYHTTSSGRTAEIEVDYHDASGYIGYDSFGSTGKPATALTANGWTQVELDLAPPAGTVAPYIYCYFPGAAAGDVYHLDLSFYGTPQAPAETHSGSGADLTATAVLGTGTGTTATPERHTGTGGTLAATARLGTGGGRQGKAPAPVNTSPAAPTPSPVPASAPRWRLCLAETITGRVVADLPFTGNPSWKRELNAAGSLSGVVVNLWPRLQQDTLTALNDDWRYTLLWCRNDTILQAGLLVGEDADDQDFTTTLSTVTLWELFNGKRPVEYPGKSIQNDDSNVVFSADSPDARNRNLSWGGVARRLVEIAITGDPRLNLPLVLPGPMSGDAEITYAGSDLNKTGQALSDLIDRDDGPEIEFIPEWRDDGKQYFQWRMRVSDDRLGQLGYPYAYDYGKALQSLKVSRDGKAMTFYVFAKGKDDRTDTGGSLTWAYSSFTAEKASQGWPLLWTVDTSHTSVDDKAAIQSYADGDVRVGQNAIYTATATLRTDGMFNGKPSGSPDASVLQTGDTLACTVTGHPRLPDGTYAVRMLAIGSGSGLDTMAADLQMIGRA